MPGPGVDPDRVKHIYKKLLYITRIMWFHLYMEICGLYKNKSHFMPLQKTILKRYLFEFKIQNPCYGITAAPPTANSQNPFFNL